MTIRASHMQTHKAVPPTVNLTADAALDARQVGAKAARLAAMLQAGFPVPPAIVVTTRVFSDFCRRHALPAPGSDHGPEAAQRINELEMPASVQADIAAAAAGLGRPLLAVRSSCTAEDSDGFSMAGQYDSFLNTALNGVCARVKACWAGLYAEAPAAYSRKINLQEAPRMGVIVQAQVTPRWSGVAFTVDPVSKSADYFVIEWVPGLGDRLVSGGVTPRRVLVRRDHPVLPDDMAPPLKDRLLQVWFWARRAERLFKQPVDMEWASDDSGVHVLQARPVTGLCTRQTVVWTNVNMAENFPHPLTPMAWSLVDGFYGAYMRSILRAFGWRDNHLQRAAGIVGNLTGIQAGRIYYNLTNWYAVMGFFPCRDWLIGSLNHYIGQKIPYQYTPATDPLAGVSRGRRRFVAAMFWPRLLKLILGAGVQMAAFESLFMHRRRQWRRISLDRMPAGGLLARLNSLLEFVDRRWAPAAMADVAVMIVPGLLEMLTRRWLPADAPDAGVRLFQGLELISMQPAVLIWESARLIKTDRRLLGMLLSGDYASLEETLPDTLRDVLARFMERFGGRCYHDCMLVAPTFEERHDLFWELVKSYAEVSIDHPLGHLARHRRDQAAYARALAARLKCRQRRIYSYVLNRARQAVALRERGRLLQSLLFGEMRMVVMALGRRLKSRGLLEEAEAVFYLHLDEIQKLLAGKFQFPAAIGDLIARRRQDLEECRTLEPPGFFFLEPGEVACHRRRHDQGAISGHRLQGTGVSRGLATGPARVIRDPLQGGRLQPGDILVTHATDPGWTPLFFIAGGLVLERGGMLSHGAIVAREFGIPAVVGVENAASAIADGALITVDGYHGTVQRHP